MRTKRAVYNTLVSLLLQIVVTVTGLILPPLIIGTFGSETNGLINSISQFLKYIALLEGGVGPVIKAALYKPLAEKNDYQLKSVLNTAEAFFKKLSAFFAVYVIFLIVIFPLLNETSFDWIFIAALILVSATNTFAQYFFGITYFILLQANQKLYIANCIQIITIIINTLLTIILIYLGSNILTITLVSSLVFIARPILLSWYVKKHYRIKEIHTEEEIELKQKWDALAQHLANIVRTSSGVLVLTVFTSLKEVSVFAVYNMVAMAVRNIVLTFSAGMGAVFGSMIAKGETRLLDRSFKIYEFVTNTVSIIFFTTAGMLIIPFMQIYTRYFDDADYIRPMFAYFLIISFAVYCTRTLYSSIVTAAGKFKATNKGAFIEAAIGLGLSIILVNIFGMTGVAFALVVAIIYRKTDLAFFASRNILKRSFALYLKRMVISIFNVVLIVIVVNFILPTINPDNFFIWAIYGVAIFMLSSVITVLIGFVFYKVELKEMVLKLKRVVRTKIKT